MNFEKEKQEVINWLKHPNELGKAPTKIQYVKDFTDEDDNHCIIFKYKTGILSPWLLAISCDSGVYSEQEKYDEKRDIEQAKEVSENRQCFMQEQW